MKQIISNNKKIISLVGLGLILLIVIITWFFKAKNKEINLTCQEAEKIVLEKLNNGIILECELNKKNYEIEVSYDNYEYEFIVNAKTGEIIEYHADTID